MQELDKQLVESLRPKFSERDIEEMKLYFEVSDKYSDDMNAQFREDLKDHPVFGPIIELQTPEAQKQRNDLSQQLTYNAIYKGDWDPYITDLIMQGVMYAKMGMTFRSWYEVVAMVKDYIMPYVIKEFGTDRQKVIAALTGLGKLTDFAMQAIAESYFVEKRSIIEAQQKKQQALIKELESFAYVVSHDLKSPLRGISKISEWLVADYKDVLDENGKNQLNLLKLRVHRLDNLIDGILQYSRLGTHKETLTDVDLNQLLKEIADLHAEEGVTIDVAADLPTVHFDRSKLNQLFSNLISNAIKYNDKEEAKVKVSFEDEGAAYRFSVKDNGPGIEPEYHDKIFGLFQTLQIKDEVESTGIGLSIVKKIIQDAGGEINVRSEIGEGTEFIFSIPKTNVE